MEIWTIDKILKWTVGFFKERGIEDARLDAEVLLAHVLDCDRMHLYVHFDQPLQAEELAAYRECIKRRVAREPVAYIVGYREFMGLRFRVTHDTLIPRPDTEILVQTAVDELKAYAATHEGEPLRLADIGTGTGAIALSVLSFVADSTAATVDISPAARAVAEENAAALELAGRIDFYTGDLLAPIAGGTFTAILSNPPYIPDADIATLEPEVRGSEPLTALAGGADGLDFYRRLCADAPAMLTAGGFMAFEVGIHQATAVAELARTNELIDAASVKIIKDYAGIERVVIAWRK